MGLFDGSSQTAMAPNGLGQISPMGGASMIPQRPPTDPYLSTNSFSPGGGSGMMPPAPLGGVTGQRPYVPLNFNAGNQQLPTGGNPANNAPLSAAGNPITQAVNNPLPSSGLPAPGQAERDAKLQQALANSRKGIGQTLDQGPGAFPQGAMGMPQRPPMAGMGGNFDPQQLRQQFQSHLANGGQLPPIPPGMDPEQLRRGMQALGMDPGHVDRAATMGAGRGPMLAQALMNRGRGY